MARSIFQYSYICEQRRSIFHLSNFTSTIADCQYIPFVFNIHKSINDCREVLFLQERYHQYIFLKMIKWNKKDNLSLMRQCGWLGLFKERETWWNRAMNMGALVCKKLITCTQWAQRFKNQDNKIFSLHQTTFAFLNEKLIFFIQFFLCFWKKFHVKSHSNLLGCSLAYANNICKHFHCNCPKGHLKGKFWQTKQ